MDFAHPPADPLPVVHQWLADARETGLPNPNAMTLATVDADGAPSARTVLLRDLDPDGAIFYTNRESRKGRALAACPRAALLFFWDCLDRQIRIEGRVTEISDAASDAYFARRPRGSQIGAWASRQSAPLAERATLERAVEEFEARFAGAEVPRPPFWGGYCVALESIVLWHMRPSRLHDAVAYTKTATGWDIQRVYP